MSFIIMWTPERIATVRRMAPDNTIRAIARVVDLSAPTVRKKMVELGLFLAAKREPRTKLQPVKFPMFQDIARPDTDRFLGRRPMRETSCSVQ